MFLFYQKVKEGKKVLYQDKRTMNINERLKHKDVHPSVSLYSSYYFQMAQCLNILVEATLLLLEFQHDYVSKDLNIFKTAWHCLKFD